MVDGANIIAFATTFFSDSHVRNKIGNLSREDVPGTCWEDNFLFHLIATSC